MSEVNIFFFCFFFQIVIFLIILLNCYELQGVTVYNNIIICVIAENS